MTQSTSHKDLSLPPHTHTRIYAPPTVNNGGTDYLNTRSYLFERIDGNVLGAERQLRVDRFNSPTSQHFCFLLRYVECRAFYHA